MYNNWEELRPAAEELARVYDGMVVEPHCRVCAAQKRAIEEEMDVVEEDTFSNIVLPLRPTNRQTFRLRRVSNLTTNFGMDESYAREANEFGY